MTVFTARQRHTLVWANTTSSGKLPAVASSLVRWQAGSGGTLKPVVMLCSNARRRSTPCGDRRRSVASLPSASVLLSGEVTSAVLSDRRHSASRACVWVVAVAAAPSSVISTWKRRATTGRSAVDLTWLIDPADVLRLDGPLAAAAQRRRRQADRGSVATRQKTTTETTALRACMMQCARTTTLDQRGRTARAAGSGAETPYSDDTATTPNTWYEQQ